MTQHAKKPKPRSAKSGNQTLRAAAKTQRQTWLIGLAVVVIVALAAGVISLLNKDANPSSIQAMPLEVSVGQAYQQYQEGAFLLDVRSQEEWNEFHAPETTLIPLDQLESRLDELPRDRDIVVVCRSGNRSSSGRDILLNAGFTRVTSMAGGLTAWRSAGYPTVAGP